MKDFLNRLKKRKGFTLIECIIAIAVFAAMVMIVFMILTRARVEAQNANKSEEDLTQLIDNVVGDETYKKYKEQYDASGNLLNALELNIAGSTNTFNITYNVVDGYKNFVICPTCDYFANNTDFMGTLAKEDFATSGTPFPYLCPSCNASFQQSLICEDCESTGNHTATTVFTYIPATGGYSCNACGGTAVKGTNIDDKVTADAKMSVSGMVPNAIAYGNVSKPAIIEEVVNFQHATGGDLTGAKLYINLSYEASANQSLPGTYTLTVIPQNLPAGTDANDISVELLFPPHYIFKNLQEVTSAGTVTMGQGGEGDNEAYLLYHFNSFGQYKVKFQLVNYKSGFSFEYDYNDPTDAAQGLAEYWFGLNGSHATPRDGAGYVTKFSATGTINDQ